MWVSVQLIADCHIKISTYPSSITTGRGTGSHYDPTVSGTSSHSTFQHISACLRGIRTLFKDFRTCCSKRNWWHTLCSVCRECASQVQGPCLYPEGQRWKCLLSPKKLLNNSLCPSFCPLGWHTCKTLLLRAVDRYNTHVHACTHALKIFSSLK